MRQRCSCILFVLHTASNKASVNQISREHGGAAQRDERRQAGMQEELGREFSFIENEHGEMEKQKAGARNEGLYFKKQVIQLMEMRQYKTINFPTMSHGHSVLQ